MTRLHVNPATVTRALFAAIGVLFLLHLLTIVARLGLDRHRLLGFVPMFDMTLERNVPACFAALNMLACAVLLAMLAVVRRRERDRTAIGWAVLSALFLLFTYDELFDMHGAIELPLHEFLQARAVPRLVSFVPYAVIAAVALVLLHLLAALPAPTRRRIVVAGAVFIAGALLIDGRSADTADSLGIPLHLAELGTQTIEELVEMIGIVLFTRALLRHTAEGGIEIAVPRAAPQPGPAPERAGNAQARRAVGAGPRRAP
jgi:hypothetical protein